MLCIPHLQSPFCGFIPRSHPILYHSSMFCVLCLCNVHLPQKSLRHNNFISSLTITYPLMIVLFGFGFANDCFGPPLYYLGLAVFDKLFMLWILRPLLLVWVWQWQFWASSLSFGLGIVNNKCAEMRLGNEELDIVWKEWIYFVQICMTGFRNNGNLDSNMVWWKIILSLHLSGEESYFKQIGGIMPWFEMKKRWRKHCFS